MDQADYRFLKLSERDKKIVEIISEVVLESMADHPLSNRKLDEDVSLSDNDAVELLRLLELLVEDPVFKRKANFVEAVASRNGLLRRNLARIYFANSRGLPRGSTSENIEREWKSFVDKYATLSFDEFLAREAEVLRECGFHPMVANLIVNLTFDVRDRVDSPPETRKNSTIKAVERTVKALRTRLISPRLDKSIRLINLSSVGIIVSNSAALFTTRDLNVVGAMSTLSGAALSLKKSK